MKKEITILVLLFFTLSLYSQVGKDFPVSTQINSNEQMKIVGNIIPLIANDGYGGVFIVQKQWGIHVEHYNKDFKLIKTTKLKAKKTSVLGVFVNNGKLNIIVRQKKKKTNTFDFLALSSPIDKFLFSEKKLISIEKKKLEKKKKSKNNDGDSFGKLIFSNNKKYFLIAVDIKNNNSEKHDIYVFNNALSPVYNTSLTINKKDKDFIIQNFLIDETDQSVYLLSKSVFSKKEKDKGAKYLYELYKMKSDGNQQKTAINLKEKYLNRLKAYLIQDKLFLLDFYSNKKRDPTQVCVDVAILSVSVDFSRGNISNNGVAYFEIDKDKMSVANTIYSPMSDQFFLDKYNSLEKNKFQFYEPKFIYITNDSDILLVAEESYKVRVGKSLDPSYMYYKNDIMVAKLNSKGVFLWARNIHKNQKQSFGGIGRPSISSSFVKNNLYVFFNGSNMTDTKPNEVKFGYNIPYLLHNSIYAVQLDSVGEIKYKKLLNGTEQKMEFNIGNGKTGQQLYYTGRKGLSKKRMLKINID